MTKGGMPTTEGVSRQRLLDILKDLSNEIRDLDVGSAVDRVPRLTAVEFLRDYVGPNKPVVITDAISHWPALRLWTDEYLVDAVGNKEVTVALTPNGRADAVTPLPPPGSAPGSGGEAPQQECFALPVQRRMPFRDFLSLFYSTQQQQKQWQQQRWHQKQQGEPETSEGGLNGKQLGEGLRPAGGGLPSDRGQQAAQEQQQQAQLQAQQQAEQAQEQEQFDHHQQQQQQQPVVYLQYQNSSLLEELPKLLDDVDEHIPWATEALGSLPEAINIWIGDERSVTSWHKDPFENLYAVVAGEKTFSLLPPSDVYRMRLRNYPLATYAPQQEDGAGAKNSGGAAGGGERLVPVLHGPLESVLWSSVQPEDGWRSSEGGSSGGSSGGSGGGSSKSSGGSCSGGSSAGISSGGGSGGGEGEGVDCEGQCSVSGTKGGLEAGEAAGTSTACGGRSACWAGELFSDPQLPRPLRVTIRPGELLYLPAIWWHQVEQKADESGRMIAVNYWYDMKFDMKFAHFKAIEALAAAAGLNESSAQ